MKKTITRTYLQQALAGTYASTDKILTALTDTSLPDNLNTWLSQLSLLEGVPFNFLVPDEAMLPPESIRFFYLDQNWVSALYDGAFSIGRNLTAESAALNLDTAVLPLAMQQTRGSLTKLRAAKLGTAPAATPQTISGFLLRSSLVINYPKMGVNVYPVNGTPDDPTPTMLDILRLEQLGPGSDTMICLVSGDAWRIDIHEEPQGLHYGIDCFNDSCEINTKPALAVKNLHTFTVSTAAGSGNTETQTVTMSNTVTPTDISSAIRSAASRVVNMQALAAAVSAANNNIAADAAVMGFEMTEGVGMVSFIHQ